MATSTDKNPFNNQVVIDHIWSFLPRKDLLNCRLVAKQNWNSASVRRLKRLKPLNRFNQFNLNRIALKDEKIIKFANFLDSRIKSIEWYPESITYHLSFSANILQRKGKPRNCKVMQDGYTALSSAFKIVQEFGPRCMSSVLFDLPESHCRGQDPEAIDLIEKVVQNASLQFLPIRFIGKDWAGRNGPAVVDIQMLARILNSANSINSLTLTPEGSLGSCPDVLTALLHVHQNVLDTIERLEITIPTSSCFESLTKISLPNLKNLSLIFLAKTWKFPEDWQHFQDFMNISCPSLAWCKFKHFVTLDKIFRDHDINFRNSFPNIQFTFKTFQTARRSVGGKVF